MSSVLTILLSHQPASQVKQVLARWATLGSAEALFLAYGGTMERYQAIDFPNMAFVDDERLRVPDQQREYQSWRGVLRAGLKWLRQHPHYDFVFLAEYDHYPLVSDLFDRLEKRALDEGADILAHHLQRIDGTSHPHYLFHSHETRFHRMFRELSQREDPDVILSMLPTGSFWTRRAFEAVASREESVPVYVELYLPTLAHHLGFRLRDLQEQNQYISAQGDRWNERQQARLAGAWSIHPVKTVPRETTPDEFA